jgi:gliding motility-associated-like protein
MVRFFTARYTFFPALNYVWNLPGLLSTDTFAQRWLLLGSILQVALTGLLLSLAGLPNAQGQAFTPRRVASGFPQNTQFFGVPRWADCDDDGDLDLLFDNAVYRNDGGVFSPFEDHLNHLQSGFLHLANWFDFNQDGKLDLLGNYALSDIRSSRYLHLTNVFPFDGCEFHPRYGDILKAKEGEANHTTIFPFLYTSIPPFIAWGDDDQDGDADILVCAGDTSRELVTRILHLNNGVYTAVDTLPIQDNPKVAAWEDFDNDGDLDVLTRKFYGYGDGGTICLWKKEPSGYRKICLPDRVDHNTYRFVRWHDLDHDGDLDITRMVANYYAGDPIQYLLELWQQGSDDFQLIRTDTLTFPVLDDERMSGISYQWGDLDNDGDVDLALDVVTSSSRIDHQDQSLLWPLYNQGDLTFQAGESVLTPPIDNAYPFTLLDYDHDGDLDAAKGTYMQMNNATSVNRPPSVPASLSTAVNGSAVTFRWNPSTDDHTPPAGLTYNVHITTENREVHYLHGLSNLNTGVRKLPRRGNAGARTQMPLLNLPDGTYFWSVQAVDDNFTASVYAPWQSFTVQKGVAAVASIQLSDPQRLNSCECGQQEIGIQTAGAFHPGNRFLIQLSDSTGSFSAPTTLFNEVDNAPDDFLQYKEEFRLLYRHNDTMVVGHLPMGIAQGTRYRVRVVSTNPVRVSPNNGYDVAIKKLPLQPVIGEVPAELCADAPNTTIRLRMLSQYANQYEWALEPLGAGVLSRTGELVTVDWNPNFSGKVSIRVRGLNGCGYGPNSPPKEVFIHPAIAAAGPIRGLTQLCPGQQTVTFEVDPIPNANSYQWTLPADVEFAPEGFSNQNRITVDLGEDFKGGILHVAGLGSCGLGAPSSLVLQSPGRVEPAGRLLGPDSLCAGSDVQATFTVSPLAHATSYTWSLMEGNQLIGQYHTNVNTLVLPIPNRPFTGLLFVKGTNDCQEGAASLSLAFRVFGAPEVPGRILGEVNVCPGSNKVVYRVPAVPSASGYHWQIPAGMESLMGQLTTQQSEIELQVSDSFRGGAIRVSAYNRCGESANSIPVELQALPMQTTLSITQSCNSLKVIPDNYPLQWYMEGQAIPGANRSEIELMTKGMYSVQVFGPCDTLVTSIKAEPVTPTGEDIPNVFTPNGDEINSTFQLAPKLIDSRLEVYNRWGKEVYQAERYHNEWDGNGVPSGTYYYALTIPCLPHPVFGIIRILR